MTPTLKTTTLAVLVALMGTAAVADDRRGGDRGPRFDFETLDINNDGFITAEEISAQQDARFTTADTDGDGQLSEAELIAQITARAAERAAERAPEMAARMLERVDANEDGVISADEMPQRDTSRLFERVDTDGDGQISAEEAEAMADRHGGRDRGGRDRS